MSAPDVPLARTAPSWSPWRAVVGFGVVSLAADMVYEGARSVTGPLLASLGASALLVGLVTGAGEALALVLRLVFGLDGRPHRPLLGADARRLRADRGVRAGARRHPVRRRRPASRWPASWSWPSAPARRCAARPSPTLLAHAAAAVGLGPRLRGAQGAGPGGRVRRAAAGRCGRGAHRRAVAGDGGARRARRRRDGAAAVDPGPGGRAASGQPLPATAGADAPAPPPARAAPPDPPSRRRTAWARLPRRFWLFAASAGAATAGPGHLRRHLLPPHPRPRRAAGRRPGRVRRRDGRRGRRRAGHRLAATTGGTPRVLLALPVLVAAVPRAGVLRHACSSAVAGVLLWGAAVGVQDSTVKALVAELVPAAAAGDGVRHVRRGAGRRRRRRRGDGRRALLPVGAGPGGRGGRDPGGHAGPAGGHAAAYDGVNLQGCADVIRVSPWRRPCTGTAAS